MGRRHTDAPSASKTWGMAASQATPWTTNKKGQKATYIAKTAKPSSNLHCKDCDQKWRERRPAANVQVRGGPYNIHEVSSEYIVQSCWLGFVFWLQFLTLVRGCVCFWSMFFWLRSDVFIICFRTYFINTTQFWNSYRFFLSAHINAMNDRLMQSPTNNVILNTWLQLIIETPNE